jgi:hypothetical protein
MSLSLIALQPYQHAQTYSLYACRLLRDSLPMLSRLSDQELHACLDLSRVSTWEPPKHNRPPTYPHTLSQPDVVARLRQGDRGLGAARCMGTGGEGWMLKEGSEEGLGLHILVLGALDLVSIDPLTQQCVPLKSLREVGDVLAQVFVSKALFSACAGAAGATTLYLSQVKTCAKKRYMLNSNLFKTCALMKSLSFFETREILYPPHAPPPPPR